MIKRLINFLRLVAAVILNIFIPGTGYFLYKKFKVGIFLFIIFLFLSLNNSTSSDYLTYICC